MASDHPFDVMIREQESDVRLGHAALLWACDEYPEMVPAGYLSRLNRLAELVGERGGTTGAERLAAMRAVLVEREEFKGNYDDFCNPSNSYLNCVLEARRGIPVSLGVVWLDVAQQLGWPLAGVGMPGHFLLRYEGVGEELIIDPFNDGKELTREQCELMLRRVFGSSYEPSESDLASIGPLGILARMLGNLYAAYVDAGDLGRTATVLRRLCAIRPQEAILLAELGRVEVLNNELTSAAATLKRALELAQTDEERSTVQHHMFELRNRLQERN